MKTTLATVPLSATLPLSRLTTDFLLVFFADPAKKFCKGWFADDTTGARCAWGHINEAFGGDPVLPRRKGITPKALTAKAHEAFGTMEICRINDGRSPSFPQRTIRARILAALRAKKAAK